MDKVLNFIKKISRLIEWALEPESKPEIEGIHSERKWALEPESKSEIEGIHLHHKDKSN